jgi:hypothetical protein
MSLIALKYIAAGMIAVGLLFLGMAIGAGWSCFAARRFDNPKRRMPAP